MYFDVCRRCAKGFFDVLQKHSGLNAQVFEHPSNGKLYRLQIGICQDLKALMMNSGKSSESFLDHVLFKPGK